MIQADKLYTYVVIFLAAVLAIYWIILYFGINETRDQEDRAELIMKGKYPSIAVLIPTIFEGEGLRKTVEKAQKMDYPKNRYYIYVVLNASTDKKTREVAKRLKNVRLIYAPFDGKSRVMNYALKKYIKQDLVLVLDADTLIERDLPKRLASHFVDKEVGATISSVQVYKPRAIIERLQKYEYLLSIMGRQALSYLGGLMIAHGAGSMFRMSALKKVGYFDEKNYTEDMEIGLKLLTHGYKVDNSIPSVSYTVVPSNVRQLVKQRVRWFSGFYINLINYRKALFSKKYGSLGMLVVPFMLISIFLSFLVLGGIIYELIILITPFYYSLINTSLGFTLQSFIGSISIFSVTTRDLLAILVTVVGLFSLFYSIASVDSKKNVFRNTLGILIYITFYSVFLSFIWLYSLILVGVTRKGAGWSLNTKSSS